MGEAVPWHRRRLRVSPGGRRASAQARMRAHLLALEAWSRLDFHAMLMRRVGKLHAGCLHMEERYEARRKEAEAVAAGWAAAARRWA